MIDAPYRWSNQRCQYNHRSIVPVRDKSSRVENTLRNIASTAKNGQCQYRAALGAQYRSDSTIDAPYGLRPCQYNHRSIVPVRPGAGRGRERIRDHESEEGPVFSHLLLSFHHEVVRAPSWFSMVLALTRTTSVRCAEKDFFGSAFQGCFRGLLCQC